MTVLKRSCQIKTCNCLAPVLSHHSVSDRIPTHWVGTVSNVDGKEFTEAEQKAVTLLLQSMDCTPIFVPVSVIRGSYLGYCKQILWPAFHNVRIYSNLQ